MSIARIAWSIAFVASSAGVGIAREEIAKLLPSDYPEGGLGFGRSVGISGGVIVVGADRDGTIDIGVGAAYVFRRDGDQWIEQGKLLPSDGALEDQFGRSVAIDGEVIVVGAPQLSTFQGAGYGAAYVFRRNDRGTPHDSADDTWAEEAKLTAPNPAGGDGFGLSVAISGDCIVVGKPGYEFSMGAAHVFRRLTAVNWVHEGALVGSETRPGDAFGNSVSVDADLIAVGSPYDSVVGDRSGSAYVFRADETTWAQDRRLVPTDAGQRDNFGNAVSIRGDYVVIGAKNTDDAGQTSGSVHFFSRVSVGSWNRNPRLTALDAGPSAEFGRSVALSSSVFIVGAPGDNQAGNHSGAGYLFLRRGDRCSQVDKLVASDVQPGMWLGSSVSIDGERAVLGSLAGVYVFAVDGEPATLSDFARFQNCFQSGEDLALTPCGAFDLDRNGVIDVRDFLLFRHTFGGP